VPSYATVDDVNRLTPQNPFTPTTTPSFAQVEQYIAQVSTRMDACLDNIGYVTPVTGGPKALAQLKEACAWGACGLAQQARIASVSPDMSGQMSVWTKMFFDWLERLASQKDPFHLIDATTNLKLVVKPLGELQFDSTNFSVDSGTNQNPGDYLTTPTFSIGMKF